jgi:hypothetical protein
MPPAYVNPEYNHIIKFTKSQIIADFMPILGVSGADVHRILR